MPHGFKCDRCEDFVEQDTRTYEAHDKLHGDGAEVVRIENPLDRSDGVWEIGIYTLCEDCRSAIIFDIAGGS